MNVARLEGKVAEKRRLGKQGSKEASKQARSQGSKAAMVEREEKPTRQERQSVILTGFILHFIALQGKESVIHDVWQVLLKVNFETCASNNSDRCSSVRKAALQEDDLASLL